MTISMRELMRDPIYRAYMKRVPPADQNPAPWQIWVRLSDSRWLTKNYDDYRDVWPVFVRELRNDRDVTITARRAFYAPPGEWYKVRVKLRVTPTTHRIESRWRQTFHWDDWRLSWCGRCRRPVEFQPLFETHHALKRWPVVSDEDNMRCPICGIRQSAQPSIDHMVKL